MTFREGKFQMQRFVPKSRFALIVIIAVLVFYAILLWYPILDQFALSFNDGLTLRRTWSGLANYNRLLNDPAFSNSIAVTLKYVLMVVTVTTLLGLLLAVAINSFKRIIVRTVLASLFFLPYIVPITASTSLWKYLLAPTGNGVLNSIITAFGLQPNRWLLSTDTALFSLALVAVWGAMGYTMVILPAP